MKKILITFTILIPLFSFSQVSKVDSVSVNQIMSELDEEYTELEIEVDDDSTSNSLFDYMTDIEQFNYQRERLNSDSNKNKNKSFVK